MRRPVALVAAAVLGLTLAGCGDDPATETPAASPTDQTQQDQSPAADAEHNANDTMFLQMMIEHHEGAIEMADLAPDQAENAELQQIAERIRAAQQPEIDQMTSMLEDWDEPVESADGASGHLDHETMQMGGRTQEEVMTELQGLSGREFDIVWLESMIQHHQGAVVMSAEVQRTGQNEDVSQMAQQIIDDQKEEIEEMEQLLDRI